MKGAGLISLFYPQSRDMDNAYHYIGVNKVLFFTVIGGGSPE